MVSQEAFVSAIIAGLATGSIYALIAFGYGLVFSTTNVFNFAQGDLVTFGAVTAYALYVAAGVPAVLAIVAVFLVVAAMGVIEERAFIWPVSGAVGSWGWLVTSLAFGIILRNSIQLGWGSTFRFFPWPFGSAHVDVFGLAIASSHIAAITAAIAVVLAFEFVYAKTMFGKAMLAVAEDRDAASVRGISVARIGVISFALAAAVSGLAGFVIAPSLSVSPEMGASLALKSFVALAIGGFTSLRGALVGGLLFGLTESITGLYVDSVYGDLMGLVLLVTVFTLLPQGLFGGRAMRTV